MFVSVSIFSEEVNKRTEKQYSSFAKLRSRKLERKKIEQVEKET